MIKYLTRKGNRIKRISCFGPDIFLILVSVSQPHLHITTGQDTLLMYLRSDEAPHHVHQLVIVLITDRQRHQTSQVVTECVVEGEVKLVWEHVEAGASLHLLTQLKWRMNLGGHISQDPPRLFPLLTIYHDSQG